MDTHSLCPASDHIFLGSEGEREGAIKSQVALRVSGYAPGIIQGAARDRAAGFVGVVEEGVPLGHCLRGHSQVEHD